MERYIEKALIFMFADIHFFLISVTSIKEGIKSLKSILKTDQELNAIYKAFNPSLEHLDNFRDHLEHIYEGRLEGMGKKQQPLRNPGSLGNLIGDTYNFGGEEFNLIESFALIRQLHDELINWNKSKNIYPIW